MFGVTDIRPRDRHLTFAGSAIQEGHRAPSIGQLSYPVIKIAIALHSSSLQTQPILIDSDHFLIHQYFSDRRRHAANVVAGHQWRAEEAPETEVRTVFMI